MLAADYSRLRLPNTSTISKSFDLLKAWCNPIPVHLRYTRVNLGCTERPLERNSGEIHTNPKLPANQEQPFQGALTHLYFYQLQELATYEVENRFCITPNPTNIRLS